MLRLLRLVVPVGFLLVASPALVFAQTQVSSISANPGSFDPRLSESTTISVAATAGVPGLEVHVFSSSNGLVRSGLSLIEGQSGVYVAAWNGYDNNSQFAAPAQYSLRVFNGATSTYLAGAAGTVSVTGLTSVQASPNPFIPTGSNATTITVQGTPGQTGLTMALSGPPGWFYGVGFEWSVPLVETTPGTYTVAWSAVGRTCYYGCSEPFIGSDGVYTIYIYDGAGTQVGTGSVTVTGVNAVTAAPAQFAPAAGETVTVTATGVAGLALEAHIRNASTSALVRTVPLTGNGTTYTGVWDGRDSNGADAPIAGYRVEVFAAGEGYRYAPTGYTQLAIQVSQIQASPNPFIPTGSNAATITVQGTPGQTGLTMALSGPPGWFLRCGL